jgi:hypothetical protein
MGKRSRHSSSSGSDDDSDYDRRKRSHRSDKGKSRDHSDRYYPSRAEELSNDDFFAKNKEFRYWLSHKRKPKDFIKMDSSDQRRYFKKFVKRWNRGKLDRGYYDGSLMDDKAAVSLTRRDDKDSEDDEVEVGPSRPTIVGPPRPKLDDLALHRERELDAKAARRESKQQDYKKEKREAKREEREDRATGRDRLLEKKAEARSSAKEMAQAKEQGEMDFSETFLLGAGRNDSFAAAIKRRDNSKGWQKEAERRVVNEERFGERQKKELQTMDMVSISRFKAPRRILIPHATSQLKALAAAKFGGAGA